MPSPFKRHSASRQIQPMSQAELDASLAELEAKDIADSTDEGVYMHPIGSDKYTIELTKPSKHVGGKPGRHAGFAEWQARPEYTGREQADNAAREFAASLHLPYLGER